MHWLDIPSPTYQIHHIHKALRLSRNGIFNGDVSVFITAQGLVQAHHCQRADWSRIRRRRLDQGDCVRVTLIVLFRHLFLPLRDDGLRWREEDRYADLVVEVITSNKSIIDVFVGRGVGADHKEREAGSKVRCPSSNLILLLAIFSNMEWIVFLINASTLLHRSRYLICGPLNEKRRQALCLYH